MRKIFIDLGANDGNVSLAFARAHPDYDIYCVEPNPNLIPQIAKCAVQAGRLFFIMWAAAWTDDGALDLFQSASNLASTVLEGKVERGKWPQIDYTAPYRVPCFDLSAWMLRTFTLRDRIILKMDIEGAEYPILERMIDDRSLLLVSELRCEWHHDRYPAISLERHERVRSAACSMTDVKDWS